MTDPALERFAEAWYRAHAGPGQDRVPDELVALVTAREPYRADALADLALVAALPRPIGFGFTVSVVEPVPVEPFDAWAESIAPLLMRWEWAADMSGLDVEQSTARVERVAREDGEWRVVTVLPAAQRDLYRQVIEALHRGR